MSAGLEICSFAHRSFTHSLISLRSIPSDSSVQMSNCERITQVSHDRMSNCAHLLYPSQKNLRFVNLFWTKINFFYFFVSLKKICDLLIPSFLMSDVSKSLRSLTKNERCEQSTQVAHQKWATMSDSLRLITKNEQIARFLSKLLLSSFFAHFFAKKNNLLKIPMSQFPTLNVRTFQKNYLSCPIRPPPPTTCPRRSPLTIFSLR